MSKLVLENSNCRIIIPAKLYEELNEIAQKSDQPILDLITSWFESGRLAAASSAVIRGSNRS